MKNCSTTTTQSQSRAQHMETLVVIRRVEEPIEWCSGMVVVPKSNGNVRICVDLTKLNGNVSREHHMLHSVEETLPQLGCVRVFSKLDTNSGFWQIKLDKASSLLTTFITSFGRYSYPLALPQLQSTTNVNYTR